MTTIDQVFEFIKEYLQWEFELNNNMYDKNVKEEDFIRSGKEFRYEFYTDSLIFDQRSRFGIQSTDDPRIIEARRKSIVKRTLFIIRKFQEAKMGDNTKLDDDGLLFSCIVGPDDKTPTINYSRSLDVARVHGELKIVSIRPIQADPFSNGRIRWTVLENSPEKEEGYYISDEGELIETYRYTPPRLDKYLLDYNL